MSVKYSKLRDINLLNFETDFFQFKTNTVLRIVINKNPFTLLCNILTPLSPTDNDKIIKEKFITSYRYYITFYSRFMNRLLRISQSYTDVAFPNDMTPKTFVTFGSPRTYSSIVNQRIILVSNTNFK